MKKYIKIIIALTLLFIPHFLLLQASEVTFRKLPQVIQKDDFIFTAKVTKISPREETQNEVKIKYSIADIAALNGNIISVFDNIVYSQVIPIVKDSSRKVILTFSPMLDASGIEFNLEKNTTYIFFSRSAKPNQNELTVYRAEPITKKNEILHIIENIGKNN